MIEPKIYFKKLFKPDDILISVLEKSNRKIDPSLEAKIKTTWTQLYKEAKKNNKVIYDGLNYRLESYEIDGENLHLTLSTFPFSIRKPLSDHRDDLEVLGPDYYANGLSIGGFIQTTDNKFVFGNKSGNTLSRNAIDFIGGTLEGIEIKTSDDLVKKNKDEILEEIGITDNEIESIQIISMVLTPGTNIIIVTHTKLNISSEQLQTNFNQSSEKDGEMSGIEIVERENLENFLKSLGGYKIHAVELIDLL